MNPVVIVILVAALLLVGMLVVTFLLDPVLAIAMVVSAIGGSLRPIRVDVTSNTPATENACAPICDETAFLPQSCASPNATIAALTWSSPSSG